MSRKTRKETIREHRSSATATFFGWLPDDNQRSMPAILIVRQDAGNPNRATHVDVMSAGVHYRNVIALRIFGHDRACERKSCLLLDWKRVQVSADQHRRTIAVP